MNDLIERQAALNALMDAVISVGVLDADDIKTVFDALPSVQHEKGQHSKEGTTSDMISRQAAIDALGKQIKQCCKALGSLSLSDVDKHAVEVEMASLRAYREMLENLPTVQPEPKWIPVERELPEDYTDVLVWFEYFRYGDYNCLYQTHGIGTYVANYNSWTVNHESGWKDLRVIAWIPLPKPYEGEGEQE